MSTKKPSPSKKDKRIKKATGRVRLHSRPMEKKEYRVRGNILLDPTDDQRAMVTMMKMMGATHEQMCRLLINPKTNLPIDVDTLKKLFKIELEDGPLLANTLVAKSAFYQAVGRRQVVVKVEDEKGQELREEIVDLGAKPNGAMTQFWLQSRAGWKTPVAAPTDENGNAVQGGGPTTVIVMLPDNGRSRTLPPMLEGQKVKV